MNRRWSLRIGAALAGLVVLFGAAAAQNLAGVFVPERTMAEHVELIRPGITVQVPDGAQDRVPAILFFHGCGGQRPMHHDHAAAIIEAGYAAVLIDSFTPRGIGRIDAMTQVCAGLRLHGQERAADVFAALDIVRADPRIDPDRLVLAGWSHGGWTLLDAMSFVSEDRLPPGLRDAAVSMDGVQMVLPIYPYCSFPARASGRLGPDLPPTQLILAGRDMVAPVGACRRLAREARAAGADLAFDVWPGLTHAFDDPDAPPLDIRMQYDAEAAARLRARLIESLRDLHD